MKDDLFDKIKEVLGDRTGLKIREADREALAKAVRSRLRANKLSSVDEYLTLLLAGTEKEAEEVRELTGMITVGESYFFRDMGQFKLIEEKILPSIIEKRGAEKTIRVWSAGCSTGEEPYSIAMLLDRALGTGTDWSIEIIATDIKDEFLEKARKGVFSKWSLRGADPKAVKGYFKPANDGFELNERLKRMVRFERGDLLRDLYPSFEKGIYSLDLVMCRNVFIYYNASAIQRIVEKLARSLSLGGFLVAGHGELFSVSSGLLKPLMFPESMVYERIEDKGALKAPVHAREPRGIEHAGVAISPGVVAEYLPRRRPEDAGAGCLKSELSEAEACFKKGEYREVVKRIRPLLKDSPNVLGALLLMAESLANMGELKEAMELLRKATGMSPLSIEPYYLLYHIAQECGDMKSAKEAMKKAIYIEPGFVAGYLDLALMYESEGEREKARKLRASALTALQKMPKATGVRYLDNITAGELTEHVKKMIA
jgi:chemotaxis protein methyltransferase CheR